MSFTDQKPFTVTPEHLDNGKRPALLDRKLGRVCFFCGKEFRVGDVIRWVYTNDQESFLQGNPFIHASRCHELGGDKLGYASGYGRDELLQRMRRHALRAETYRWFFR
jgi:hypothetical protein